MVRSHWIGLVFGVLAVNGLAWGQSPSPVPSPLPLSPEAGAGAPKDRIVVVQEASKPPQRCKILKMWTEPDGTPAFQVQALDTGELITIEETDATAPKPGALVRSASMRIFHWAGSTSSPVGTPEPPPNAVVVGQPIDVRPLAPEPPRVAAVPAPVSQPRKQWPSAHVEANGTDLAASAPPQTPPPTAQIAPPPKKVELAPIPPAPVVANHVTIQPMASAPAKLPEMKPPPAVAAVPAPEHKEAAPTPGPAPASPYAVQTTGPIIMPQESRPATPPDLPANASPYASKPVSVKPAPVVAVVPAPPPSKAWTPSKPEAKPAPPSGEAAMVWKPVQMPAPQPTPPPAPKQTVVVKQVETTAPLAPPVPVAPPSPAKDPVVAKKVETSPAQQGDGRQSWGQAEAPPPAPILPAPPMVVATPTVAVTAKVELPHAAQRADDPLNTPDKFARIPATGGFDPDKSASDKKAPLLAALALGQPPTAAKEPPPPAVPPLPGPPAPQPAHVSAPVLQPAVTPAAVPAPVLQPVPATKPAAPTQAQSAPAAPAVPLGLGSVLAAASPELGPPPPPAKVAAPEKTEIGIRADEPNAFSDRRTTGAVASAANAFSAPAPAAPPPDAVAINAFPTPPPTAPSYAPTAVAMRTAPRPAMSSSQAPVGYVVSAGYKQDSGYDLTQLTGILHDSLYPSQREWAAESLASMDWRRQPQIVDVLVEGAKNDPAPGVRAECLRSLGRMKADTVGAIEVVKALRSDADAQVDQAADEAYGALTAPAQH